jgi:hypothetical protein
MSGSAGNAAVKQLQTESMVDERLPENVAATLLAQEDRTWLLTLFGRTLAAWLASCPSIATYVPCRASRSNFCSIFVGGLP